MIKKLAIGGLVVILAGALALGIYSFTQDDSGLRAGQALAQGNGDGQGYQGGRGDTPPGAGYENDSGKGNYTDCAPAGNNNGNQGQGYRGGQAANAAQVQRGDNAGTGIPQPQAEVSEWFSALKNTISAAAANAANPNAPYCDSNDKIQLWGFCTVSNAAGIL